jgi:hypothetical protein
MVPVVAVIFLVAGGISGTGTCFNGGELYDPSTNKQEALFDLSAHAALAASALAPKAIVAGPSAELGEYPPVGGTSWANWTATNEDDEDVIARAQGFPT